MVGAVLVGPEGTVLGEGWHRQYGGPHAEAHAIQDAEDAHGPDTLRDATLYVNLEPCSHHGKTPPCTDLILEKGIPRLVVGTVDPFPSVKGRGIRRLREHGVEVQVGVLRSDCFRLNEAFFHHVETGRPLVTLKVAQTLDGQVATRTGDSQWISGEASRTLVHRWRAELDGVMVGSGTARSDDPRLTVRHVDGAQPVRVVLDREGSLSPQLSVLTDDHAANTVVAVAEGTTPPYADALRDRGGHVVSVPETPTCTASCNAWARTPDAAPNRCSRSSSKPVPDSPRPCCAPASWIATSRSSRPSWPAKAAPRPATSASNR